MGLRGVWAQVANMTAVVFVCVMFYFTHLASLEQAREERALFRGAVATLSANQERQWTAIRTLTAAVKRLLERAEGGPCDGEGRGKADAPGGGCGCAGRCPCGHACRCGPEKRCVEGCDCLALRGDGR